MPTFWLALMLVQLLSLKLDLLPVSGCEGLGGVLRSPTLPALALSLFLAPMLTRTLRASLIDALHADYVDAARARGSCVRVKHGAPCATRSFSYHRAVDQRRLPAQLYVVVENVFQIPGLGSCSSSRCSPATT